MIQNEKINRTIFELRCCKADLHLAFMQGIGRLYKLSSHPAMQGAGDALCSEEAEHEVLNLIPRKYLLPITPKRLIHNIKLQYKLSRCVAEIAYEFALSRAGCEF